MKNNLKFLASLALAACVAAPAFAAGEHDHAPKNGGIVVETKAGDFEIVAKSDLLQIFISDHGKPVSLDGAKAKVTLLNGTEKSEAELLPAGNKLEAKGSFKVAKGTKGIAVLTLAGKPPATARFEVK
ncbi:MAG: hypothetical protein CFE43_08095 [Burkholderiales bacterium PBB3]|nr:MAG: hypothetical protein CFE43_08095 [Burkholderiales bacterium PBB3]